MTSAAISWPDRALENPPNPYLPSNSAVSNFSYPLLPLNVANQAMVGQHPQIDSPQIQNTTCTTNSAMTSSNLLFKEGKPLGVIQIMIALIHIGLGIILGFLSIDDDIFNNKYITLSFIGGYPFWGGVSVKGIVGMNIVSALCTVVGIILLLIDMFFNGEIMDQSYSTKVSGQGLSGLLVIFTLLELSLISKISSFALQMLLNNNSPIMIISNTYAANSHSPNVSTGGNLVAQ